MKPSIKAVETDDAASEGAPEETGAPAAPPTAFHAFAERIGSRNLMLAIVTMPLFFLGALVLVIAIVGLPEDEAATEDAAAADAVLEALGAPAAPEPAAESAGAAPAPAVDAFAGAVVIPDDATIGDMVLDGDRLALRVDKAEGPVIIIYDIAQDRIVRTIPLSALIGPEATQP